MLFKIERRKRKSDKKYGFKRGGKGYSIQNPMQNKTSNRGNSCWEKRSLNTEKSVLVTQKPIQFRLFPK